VTASMFASPEAWLTTLIYSMLRTGAAFAASPVFSAMGMPVLIRVALSMTLGVLLVEQNIIATSGALLSSQGVMVALSEVAIGLMVGFCLQLVFAAPMLAGDYISNTMGLGFAAMMDPQSGVTSPAIAHFFTIYTTLAFLTFDGHLFLIEVMMRSYSVVPFSGHPSFHMMLKSLVGFAEFVFSAGFNIALPVGVCVLAANLMMATMTRSAPQMNIFSIGVPVTLLVGLIAMALFFPALAELTNQSLTRGRDMIVYLLTVASSLK
jgi:flagellar biosynthesis protein FliR